MSREVDLSDINALTEDELRYCLDRHMITDEQFEEAMEANAFGDSDEEDYSSWSAADLAAEWQSRVDSGREMGNKPKNKKECIAALEADDEAAANEEG